MDNKYDKVELNRHRFYLHKEFSIECHNIFSEEEKVILVKYGEWMRALVNGDISPITPAQVHFVEVFKKNISPQTKYEKIWKKYNARITWESKYGDTSDRPPKTIPRHWEGISGPTSRDAFDTYQL